MCDKRVVTLLITALLSLCGCGDPEPSPECGEAGSRCVPEQDMGGGSPGSDMSGSAGDMGQQAMASGLLGRDGTVETVSLGEAKFLASSEDDLLVVRSAEAGLELETSAWRVPVTDQDARTFLAANALSPTQWLLVSEERGLELVDAGGITNSPLQSLLEMGDIRQLNVTQTEGAPLLWFNGISVYLWSDDELARIEAPMLDGETTLFDPPTRVEDGADVWAYNEQGVHAIARDAEGVTVTLMRPGAVRSAASNHGAAWVVTTNGEVFRHAGDGAWQKLKISAPIASIHAHPAAADVWFVAESGKLWHLWGEVLVEVVQTLSADARLTVDPAGRLLEQSSPGGEVRQHDRKLRLELEGLDSNELVVEPRALALKATFAADLESVTASSGNITYPTQVSDGVASFMLDPSALGPGEHTLKVRGKWRGVAQELGLEVTFRVESGELSWQQNIRPIFDASCKDCHSVQANKPFHTHDLWVQEYENILVWVEPGNMPPGNLPKLTPAQIELIKGWAAQGYPE